MRIAVHQMTSLIDPDRNVSEMVNAIGDAANQNAAMYFAPEMSVLVDKDRRRAKSHVESESQSTALNLLRQSAKENAIWVHVGSMPFLSEESDKLVNRTILIGPDGHVVARYDKMHLFDVDLADGESWRESSAYVAGTQPVLTKTPLGLMGLAICYDMRFPDLFSAYAKCAMDVVTVPSAFTVPTGEAHWHSLLRARAIESEAFVIAAAQCGLHEDGRQTYGHSLVVDPWGTVVLDMGTSPGLAIAELDLDIICQVRKQIPVHANRRLVPKPFIAE